MKHKRVMYIAVGTFSIAVAMLLFHFLTSS